MIFVIRIFLPSVMFHLSVSLGVVTFRWLGLECFSYARAFSHIKRGYCFAVLSECDERSFRLLKGSHMLHDNEFESKIIKRRAFTNCCKLGYL